MAARPAMSHGATSRVAKLALESTTLPLRRVGCCICAGSWAVEVGVAGLMRDVVGKIEGVGSASELFDTGDSLLLFLE